MNKARKVGITPNVTYLGSGAIYYNWGLEDEMYVGMTKGGNEFTDNAEYKQSEHDGSYFPSVGEQRMVKMKPELKIKALTLSKENLMKFYSGMKEDNNEVGKTKLYRTFDMCESYIKNVAFVGVTADTSGKERYILIVLKNVLGVNPFQIPATGQEEDIVVDAVLTAHIDPSEFEFDDMTTYPYFIEFATSEITFTVDDGDKAVSGANIIFNGTNYVQTGNDGIAIMYTEKGNKLPYTVTKDGYEKHKGVINLHDDMLQMNVSLTKIED